MVIKTMHFQLVIAILVSFQFSLCSGFKISRLRGEPSVRSRPPGDLVSLLHIDPAEQSDIFSEAIQLLDSMQSAPSCNQRAVASLITSCQVLSTGENDKRVASGVDLDHIKSLYAARLAVCEVMGAGAMIPGQCSSILTSRTNEKPLYNSGHKETHSSQEEGLISSGQLEPCLRSLESKPQWWTSYSNSRQNAAVMCQAARFDVERDELLNNHRSLTEITFGLKQALNHSLENAITQNRQQKVFLETVNDMRLKLLHDIQENNDAARDQFSTLVTDTKSMFQDAQGDLRGFLGNALSDVATLSKSIGFSAESIRDLREAISETYSDGLKRNSELVAAEQTTLRRNADLAIIVRQSLDEIRNMGLGLMVEEFGHLHSSLNSLNEVISSVHQKHSSLDKRIQQLDGAFQQFENRAIILEDMMVAQIVNHSRLQQSFQADLLTTQELLNDITTSTIDLQSAIGDAQQLFHKITQFSGSIGSLGWWTWGILFFCALAILSPRTVATILFLCVAAMGFLCTGAFDWFRSFDKPTFSAVRAASYLDIVCFSVGFILSTIVVTTIAMRGNYLSPTSWLMRLSRFSGNNIPDSILPP